VVKRDSIARQIEGDVVPPHYRLEVLQAHPRFDEAMLITARQSVDQYSRSRVAGWLLSDRTLAVLALGSVCLDAETRGDESRSGLTPSRFKAFCVENRVCSEGRAAAVLAFLRLSGHIEAEAHPGDRRITRLRPSGKLADMVRTRLRSQLEVASILAPEIAPAAKGLDDPEFERLFYCRLLDQYNAGMRLLAYAPAIRLFAERDVGVLVLLSLMLGGEAAELVPPEGPMPLSIAALARRFRVSRTHILRMVRDAEAAALVSRTGAKGEQLVFSPELRADLRNLVASMYQYVTLCAAAVLTQHGRPSRD
jgi:hypothetical protein